MWRNNGSHLLSTSVHQHFPSWRFADAIGAAEAIVGIGFAVAAANRLETLAVLADNAKTWARPRMFRIVLRNVRQTAGRLGGTFSRGWFAPQALVARGSGGAAAGCPLGTACALS